MEYVNLCPSPKDSILYTISKDKSFKICTHYIQLHQRTIHLFINTRRRSNVFHIFSDQKLFSSLCPRKFDNSSSCKRINRREKGEGLLGPLASYVRSITTQMFINIKSQWLIQLTAQWFRDNLCAEPLPATCLFYTTGQSENARTFATSDGITMTTIWVSFPFIKAVCLSNVLVLQEMWDPSYYDDDTEDENNPLRCIMADEVDRRTYFKAMSGAMAYYCQVFATVMSDKDLPDVPKDGIWYTIEYQRLMRTDNKGKSVNEIALIKPDGSNPTVYWKRPDSQKREETYKDMHDFASLVQRETTCGAPKGVEAVFDAGGRLPVDW